MDAARRLDFPLPKFQCLQTRTRSPADPTEETQEGGWPEPSTVFRGSGRPQSFMSNVESGTRRMDIVQLRELIAEFERSLDEN